MFTKLINVIFLLLVAMIGTPAANAQENQVEWRVLGPSFSHHSNNKKAPIVVKGEVTFSVDSNDNLYVSDVVPPVRAWSQSNPSLGVEKSWQTDAESTSRDRIFASAIRDSNGKMGVMAGVGRSWQIMQAGSVKVEVGLAGGAWYRTIIKDPANNWQLSQFKYRLVPFILPVLSINEETTGIGVNVSVAPKFIGKNFSIPTTTVMIQTSFLF